MKRYRVFSFDLDSRASSLTMMINSTWEPQVQELHRRNMIGTLASVLNEFGPASAEVKIQNFIDLGTAPFSIQAFHNRFLDQIQSSFVAGSYYPALTGACALGERILNHLILKLMEKRKRIQMIRQNTDAQKRVPTGSDFVGTAFWPSAEMV